MALDIGSMRPGREGVVVDVVSIQRKVSHSPMPNFVLMPTPLFDKSETNLAENASFSWRTHGGLILLGLDLSSLAGAVSLPLGIQLLILVKAS